MIDMSTWEELVADVVDDLRLDSKNVRIEQLEGVPEVDIIHDLFSTEKAFALVEGIVKIGFLTHEVPIVVRRDNRLIVVEGNRRVAALKAMQNPYLAPEYQARITKLIQTVPNLSALKKIAVKRAPNQDDADQLIAALHTGNQRLPWGPTRQAAFFQAQIDSGKTYEQLIVQYPLIDVKEFVVRSRILNLFRSVKYRNPALVDYIKQRRFPISTLARLYGNDKFLELAQIDVDSETAGVTLRAPRSEFARLAEKIITDMLNKDINTRVLNKTSLPSYIGYMDDLRSLLNEAVEEVAEEEEPPINPPPPMPPNGGGRMPSAAGGNSGGASGGSGSTPTAAGGGEDSSSAKSKANPLEKLKKKRNYLGTEQLQVPDTFPESIRAILGELSTLNIQRFPNAALDLLRTFLEKVIKAYAEELGENIKSAAQQSGYVQLGHCLIWLEEHLKTTNRTAYLQVISKIRGNRIGDYIMTMDHMNAINHNHQVFATTEEVRSCWDGMEGLIKVMLTP